MCGKLFPKSVLIILMHVFILLYVTTAIDREQEYWMEHDQSGEYPHDLHRDLARDGWIGIALPEELGGSGLGISEATMMLHTISE